MVGKSSKTFKKSFRRWICRRILLSVAKILCPEKSGTFDKISLSRRTIKRRVKESAVDIEGSLTEKKHKRLILYSLAIDESSNITYSIQLTIFMRSIDKLFKITEQLLSVQIIKYIVTGWKIYEELKKAVPKLNLLVNVEPDGAPAMIVSKIGFLTKLKEELNSSNIENSNCETIHCITHRENLCAKSLNFKNDMRVVVLQINFINSRALKHRLI